MQPNLLSCLFFHADSLNTFSAHMRKSTQTLIVCKRAFKSVYCNPVTLNKFSTQCELIICICYNVSFSNFVFGFQHCKNSVKTIYAAVTTKKMVSVKLPKNIVKPV